MNEYKYIVLICVCHCKLLLISRCLSRNVFKLLSQTAPVEKTREVKVNEALVVSEETTVDKNDGKEEKREEKKKTEEKEKEGKEKRQTESNEDPPLQSENTEEKPNEKK